MEGLSLPVIIDPPVDHADVESWLQALGGPVWLVLEGEDDRRCRVVTTLLHGNEPSGALALHRWLAERPRPRTRLAVLLANVRGALSPPTFTHRHTLDDRDLNRCFRPPFAGPDGELAWTIIQDLETWAPECVIDLHNTSGNGPAFAVTTRRHPVIEALAGRFCEQLIVTDLRLGSLMELPLRIPGLAECPVFTLECGGALQPGAREVADGLYRLLAECSDLTVLPSAPGLEVLVHPLRVELRPGASVAYDRSPRPDVDLTLWVRIDEHNRGVTSPAAPLGWLGHHGLACLQARDGDGREHVGELFCVREGRLHARRPLRLFMATTNSEIARSDCLFYAVPLA
ncbi:succinylglutamate desuccinylase/aspartoacylase domain-containing protein [Halomonas heilongjiangensis]|uniref:Succinylglutamate desuccinylase n=1 Tax=Halomonas heilongjiangensis TaxID=1387883 RepID=A0A2N7TPZ1_9GAMM|nr:succinylglutamate desuccinylase/aspartoacylase family protein [Halomonas heilongjiangensis]PMR70264.1 succinylglutamate desuccinylase [Halomonas heilongjiangensis]PXX87283.1 succinylglutamate desuccinylase [Halomonas heilongjiangensis]